MAVLLILLAFFVLLCITAWHKTGYWKRRGINGPPSVPFLGIIHNVVSLNNPNVFVYQNWTKIFGKIYGIQKGWRNGLVISDEKMVHEMMTTKFEYFHERETQPIKGNIDKQKLVNVFRARGKRWKRLRTLSNPVFSVQNLKKILPSMEETAQETMDFLEKAASNNTDFNIHPFFHEYTMSIISKIALGQADAKQFQNEYTQILISTLQTVENPFSMISWVFPILSPLLQKIQAEIGKANKSGFMRLIENVSKTVNERKIKRAQGEINEDRVDFIDLFLNAESAEVDQQETGVYDKSNAQVSKRLTIDEVIAMLNIFLLAGFDTTANTLALTCHYLAKYPKIQDRLREEIDSVCVSANPTYEELNGLKYADAIMKEVLRLTPIAGSVFNRTCAATTTLGDLTIEKGTHVQVDLFSLHYDKEIWGSDAEEFVPDRWLKPQVPTAFYPFGGGPRICIGMRLAYLEEKLILIHILRRYRIVTGKRSASKLTFNGQAVLNPDNVFVQLEELH